MWVYMILIGLPVFIVALVFFVAAFELRPKTFSLMSRKLEWEHNMDHFRAYIRGAVDILFTRWMAQNALLVYYVYCIGLFWTPAVEGVTAIRHDMYFFILCIVYTFKFFTGNFFLPVFLFWFAAANYLYALMRGIRGFDALMAHVLSFSTVSEWRKDPMRALNYCVYLVLVVWIPAS